MRRLFDEELDELDNGFTEMGILVSNVVQQSVDAFINHDRQSAQAIIDNDHKINEREINLESKSFEIIALYQPVTSDLREVVTILKAVSDLERAGDHARNIAHATIEVKGNTRVAEIETQLAEMGHLTTDMVKQAIQAYVDKDEEAAKALVTVNDQLIEYRDRIMRASYNEIATDADVLVAAMNYNNVAADLVRIADYLTNVGEWIVYLKTGQIIELKLMK
ncbi:phosphate signaling complex protein PhoU [Lactobacillus sp. LC28-10]|uniref:Phosphate-specific transport system accessory protein PhoU n=1 Tax=Secundilactobacillus angelensis TaxID=2722706 RepID=A0ABX1L2D2_9LACO|nr:phosphate signaling complex protein PhoU [Secundilactobacillus angelensis]MCH5462195.1 phosphate signaling complex protein PhoU [Secundilactobacillus angelensis]NLR18486.1 phosphate signaling complex protein PhoU [Secundilactobacillus angelensis]